MQPVDPSAKRFFKITLAYDGTLFAGYQRQVNQRSVQGELEEAIQYVLGQHLPALASGRTDAGVHALAQVVSIACNTEMSARQLCKALNARVPDDIFIKNVEDAPFGFHSIRDAVSKRYRYVIQDGQPRDIFARPYAWYVRRKLDVEAMHRAAQLLLGTHDFISFESAGSQRLTTVRTIYDISVERRRIDHSDRVVIEVEADGFLYNMVRTITGTLVAVGKGKQPEHWVTTVLEALDRRAAGMSAPAHGLFMVAVKYDFDTSPTLEPSGAGEGRGAEAPTESPAPSSQLITNLLLPD